MGIFRLDARLVRWSLSISWQFLLCFCYFCCICCNSIDSNSSTTCIFDLFVFWYSEYFHAQNRIIWKPVLRDMGQYSVCNSSAFHSITNCKTWKSSAKKKRSRTSWYNDEVASVSSKTAHNKRKHKWMSVMQRNSFRVHQNCTPLSAASPRNNMHAYYWRP